MKRLTAPLFGLIALALPLAAALTYLWVGPAFAQEPHEATVAASATHANMAMLGAAISAGLASLGAAYAVAVVGSSAVGALTEKPELLGRLLILVGLAEGIAIYGLIVAVLILNTV
ncbi:ATP synthase subunit C [Mesobacterium sp. TK19101]|uniref:ATP synthase subunit C n=1 Tax=Mesobacterium hydrothermale TaxID=3111907 RepID=A0ABU6HK06_9RHOB|nr:ATP synthase subunit C [Mesobacterium sp. TK19101]MEC3862783.1 ATP synthase subunit C [Mesobacterium sp. TK19101]